MEQETKQCPYCGEVIKAKAQKCRFCGKWLNEEANEQTNKEAQETKKCPACGEEILAVAQKCRFCGEILNNTINPNTYSNYSRPQKQLPYELQKFNWGAFCFSWLWGLYNNSYMTFWIFAALLLILIPFVGGFAPLALCIWFGVKGNEWAWNNKEWRNIEHFNSVQIHWAKAGIVYLLISAWISICTIIYIALVAIYEGIFG